MLGILPYLKTYKKYYLLAGLILVGSAILSAIGPYFYKLIIDNGIVAKRFDLLLRFALTMLFIDVVAMVLEWFKTYYFNFIGQGILRDIKIEAFKQLTCKSSNFYFRFTTGDLIERLDGDTAYLESVLTREFMDLISDILIVIAMSGFLIYLNYQLFLCIVIVLPVAYLAQKKMGSRLDQEMTTLRKSFSQTSSFFVQTIANMVTFQNHGSERALQVECKEKADNLAVNNVKVSKTFATTFAALNSTSSIAYSAIMVFGGYLAINGQLSLGGLVSFTSYFFKIFGPIQNFARLKLNFVSAKVAWQRIVEIIEDKDVQISTGNEYPDLSKSSIEFKNVHFEYQINRPVLENVSWILPHKKTLIIQGASGAGKTTSVNLMLKHFLVEKGSILFGGIKIENVCTQWLRENIFIVEQDPLVVSGSLLDNLNLFSDRKFTTNEIYEALYRACLDRLVENWPAGIESMLGENGINLSGGQRQRIALARSILAKPAVLILDEATSAIDLDTELEIMSRMEDFLFGRTVILISHRPPELLNADLILDLDKKIITDLSILRAPIERNLPQINIGGV